MLLDEVDKLGRDALRGDPAAALLEVCACWLREATEAARLFELPRGQGVSSRGLAGDCPTYTPANHPTAAAAGPRASRTRPRVN